MGFSLGDLLFAALFFVNAIAILNEQRFLARIGWGTTPDVGFAPPSASVKSKVINLISSVQTLLRIPLIFINSLVIIYELVLG